MSLLDLIPAPGQEPDWTALCRFDPRIEALHRCPQDPVWHAEGDVGVHTSMLLDWLCACPAWQGQPLADRQVLFLAGLLHDIAKPLCTRVEDDGRISSRGHSRVGAVEARRWLWELGLPFAQREAVCALIKHHQVPMFLINQVGGQRQAALLSQSLRCDQLALLAEADACGRSCVDQDRLVADILLFGIACEEWGHLKAPYPFSSGLHRHLCAQKPERSLLAPAFDESWGEVILMSGLPGAGKDTWIARNVPHLPVVSLDRLREELDTDPDDEQGSIVQAAKERAREHLRRHKAFVWNGTNLDAQRRAVLVQLFSDYGARVHIVYVEAPASRLWRQNSEREAQVPEGAIRRMMHRWQVPECTEAPRVDWVVSEP